MSGALLGIGALGVAANFATALFRPQRGFYGETGLIIPDVVISEAHHDTMTITQHPVQQGATISDHAYLNPAQVNVTCAWSSSSVGSVLSMFTGGDILGNLSDGVFGDSYVQQVYNKMRALQASREPFSLTTGKRQYKNMLITDLAVETDSSKEYALFLTATCQEVIIVTTATTSLPARDQATPEKTASQTDTGAQSSTPAPNYDSALKTIVGGGKSLGGALFGGF